MSNTTPDPGQPNGDGASDDGALPEYAQPEGTEATGTESTGAESTGAESTGTESTGTESTDAGTTAAEPTPAGDETRVHEVPISDVPVHESPASETRGTDTAAVPAGSPDAPAHHHTPEVADHAYAEKADTHVLSSSEPTVLTQADLHADKVRAEESARGGDTAVAPIYTDSTAPVTPAPAASPDRAEPAPVRQPVYVQAPTEPKPKGNRGFGILVALLATVVFAALYAGVLALLLVVNNGSVDIVNDVLVQAPFWVPAIFFFVALALLVTVVNRGGWWAYVLGGFVVAAIVYGSYLGGVLIEQAARISPSEVGGVVQNALFSPAAVIAFVIAREVPIWFGAWVASRGRKVRDRNDEARREYQRVLDEGPVVS